MRRTKYIVLALLLLAACKELPKRHVSRGFYFWRTSFDPSPRERQYLQQLSVEHLYVRLFDVDLNEGGVAVPVGKLLWRSRPPDGIRITPVAYVTQEVLRRADSVAIDALAPRIAALMSEQCPDIALSGEVQIDCDWSAGTRARYFQLLRLLQEQPFFKGKTLSVTIRLHQLKYIAANGIPPAAKGLLMCYNMGNLRAPGSANSIIDPDELQKYTAGLRHYPLPLDVALPVFSWGVWFEGDKYKGLVYLPDSLLPRSLLQFRSDSVLGGYRFRRGDRLRPERSDAASVERVAGIIAKGLRSEDVRVLLFQLDEQNLAGYPLHELENFYERLHYRPARLSAPERN